ncbi:MAG: adenylate/guanylate cyclase domain-containing protein [Acetobacteraceae bacterium]
MGPDLGSGQVGRRLAAFLALDIKDYSAMMSHNEAETHRNVGRDLAVVVRQIHRHGGLVLQFSGDGLLAEFNSAAATLQAALQIQSSARKRNQRRFQHQQIEYRIGVNVGDIVVQGNRIGGDTVNVAARLEQISEPGGICISEAVFAQVHRRVRATYTSIGVVRLKNISHPVGIYRVSGWRRESRQDWRSATPAVGQSPPDYRPSIAVLPLENPTAGGEPDYFAAGVVEDIIVSLSGLRELRVISRSSTLSYRSGQTDVREVGRALGVGYVLSGSIRRSADVIRGSVELSDAQTGFSLWAETAEFPPDDLFKVQDRLVERVVTRIAPHIRDEELRRAMRQRPESMTAYDRTLQALHLMDYLDKDMFGAAREVLAQAMAEDPRFAMPAAWSVWWHIIWIGQGWSTDPAGDYATARTLAERAVTLDPNNALALAMMAHMHSYLRHDYDAARLLFARALGAGPGNAIVVAMNALTLAYLGRGEDAVQGATQAIRLSPLDHRLFLFHNILAWSHFAAGNPAEAAKWARASDIAAPRFTANLRILIGSLVASGAVEEAQATAARLIAHEPDFTLSRYESTLLPFQPPELRERLLTALRLAGLPD